MSLSNSDVAHRWAHADFGKDGEVIGSNYHGDSMNLYSYSTVIAQCLDRERHVFLVIDESLTPSTSKHVAYVNRAIPGDWLVIHTHWEGGRFDNVNFLGRKEKFDRKQRTILVTHLLSKIYDRFECALTTKSLKYDSIQKGELDDIMNLNNIYGDCSVGKWLNGVTYKNSGLWDKKMFLKMKKMARKISEDCTDGEIMDAMFGEGKWDAYQKRISPLKKGAETREKYERLKAHLGYRTKHDSWRCEKPECPYTNKELSKLTAREVLDIRFDNIEKARMRAENKKYVKQGFNDAKDASLCRIEKFLGISERCAFPDRVVKPDGTIVYNSRYNEGYDEVIGAYVWVSLYNWDNARVCVSPSLYSAFRTAKDKFKFRERFWQLCALKMRRVIGAYLFAKKGKYDEENIPLEFTEEENHIYNEYVVRFNRQQELEEKRRKIEEAHRAKEREEQMQKIDAYRENGLDGIRRLWIEHLQSVHYDVLQSPEVCYGGNILLRFATQSGYVETSKGIRIPFADCHKYWQIIKAWHEGRQFSSVQMAGYTVSSFHNDILTAGCHRIAFCEMERMYNEICKREAA